jgi:carbon storage regulator
MLVLTRKTNESIIVGESIEIKIARINGNQVRVGITAPKNIPVYRKEIYDDIQNKKVKGAD